MWTARGGGAARQLLLTAAGGAASIYHDVRAACGGQLSRVLCPCMSTSVSVDWADCGGGGYVCIVRGCGVLSRGRRCARGAVAWLGALELWELEAELTSFEWRS